MKRKKLTVAVDFDGVIYDRGREVPGANYALQDIIDQGYRLVIHTLRARTASGKAFVIEWLDKRDLPYHEVTATKPDAFVFVDDKAIRFTAWYEVLPEIELRDPLSVIE